MVPLPCLQEWGSGGLMFDASDRDGADEEGMINLQSWPSVKGMYMPDSITTFKAQGKRCECAFLCLLLLSAFPLEANIRRHAIYL